MSSNFLLPCKVSIEKSTERLAGVPLYLLSHFFLDAFKLFFFFLTFKQYYYNVSHCGFLWVHLSGICLTSSIWKSISFPNWEFAAVISSNNAFCFFSFGNPKMCLLILFQVSYHSFSLSLLFLISFFTCSSNWAISNDISLSSWIFLLLDQIYCWIFQFIFLVLQLQIFDLFFFLQLSVSYWYSHFVHESFSWAC